MLEGIRALYGSLLPCEIAADAGAPLRSELPFIIRHKEGSFQFRPEDAVIVYRLEPGHAGQAAVLT